MCPNIAVNGSGYLGITHAVGMAELGFDVIAIGAGLATIFFMGYAIKFGLARTPPADGIDMLHGDGQAVPSGHTANATFTWIILVVVWLGLEDSIPTRPASGAG